MELVVAASPVTALPVACNLSPVAPDVSASVPSKPFEAAPLDDAVPVVSDSESVADPPVPSEVAPDVTPVISKPFTDAMVSSKPFADALVSSKPFADAPVSSKPLADAPISSKPVIAEPVPSQLAADVAPVLAPEVAPVPSHLAPDVAPVPSQLVPDVALVVSKPVVAALVVSKPLVAKPIADAALGSSKLVSHSAPVTDVPATLKPVTDISVPSKPFAIAPVSFKLVPDTASVATEPGVVAKARNLVSFEYEVQSSEYSKCGKYRKYVKPTVASLVAALGSVVIGTLNGYPSPAVPNLNNNPNPFRMDIEEQSWFGSLLFLSGIVGALFGSYMIDRFGRKFSLLMVSLPFVVGWTIIAGSYNPTMMYIGRLTCGFCFAIVLSTIGVYISEISPPEIRGILISIHEFGVSFGLLGTYVVGSYLPWNWLAIFCASISCIQATLLLFVPETPRWLVMNGQREAAVKSLAWLRGHGVHLELEMATIQHSLKETAEPVPWKEYFRPPLLRCLFVTLSLYGIQQLSGVSLVRTYTVSIFEDTGTKMDPYLLTVIVGAVMLGGSVVGTLVVDCFERRTLLLFSTLVMGLSMLALGAFFEVKKLDPYFAKTYISWLPLISLICVSVGYVMGLAPIPNVVTSELFSTRARGRASCFGIATLCLCGFLSTKLYSNMVSGFGAAGAFWFCTGICLVGSVVIFFFVPMTKGQSLEHIQSNLGQ